MDDPDLKNFTVHAEPYSDGSSAVLSVRCPRCLGYELGNWDLKEDDDATPTVADILAVISAHEHTLIA